jgi:hypothetical protein
MATARWNDFSRDYAKKGDTCYIVETVDTSSGREYYEARSQAWKTNQSGEEKLKGWLGETNNKSRYAMGRARITSVKNDGNVIGFSFLAAEHRWEE